MNDNERKQFDQAYKNKKYEQCIELLTPIIKKNPNDAEAFINRSRAYLRLKKEDEAKNDLDKAQNLDPNLEDKLEVELEKRETKMRLKNTTEDFVNIFSSLEEKHKKEERLWLRMSAVSVVVFLFFLFFKFEIIEKNIMSEIPFYFKYGFSSAIVFLIIQQYIKAKILRIEAVNRVAMVNMFNRFVGDEKYDIFLPKMIDAIVYSTRKTKTKRDVSINIEKLLDMIPQLKK